jgi:hypothetical protein
MLRLSVLRGYVCGGSYPSICQLSDCGVNPCQGVSQVLVHSTKRQGNRIDGESGNRGSWALGAESC